MIQTHEVATKTTKNSITGEQETTKLLVFTLNTNNTTYQMQVGKYGYLEHLYYGAKITSDATHIAAYDIVGFQCNPHDAGLDRTFSPDCVTLEYPAYGNGDFRSPAFTMKTKDGVYGCDLRYKSHSIQSGTYTIPGLPAVYSDVDTTSTLEIVLHDPMVGIEVALRYGVLEEKDCITRAVMITNTSVHDIVITKAQSMSIDARGNHWDLINLSGRWAFERNKTRTELVSGITSFGSRRGIPSHQENPFAILCDRDTTEYHGDCYAFTLLYSGQFLCEAEVDSMFNTRINLGIQSDMFEYTLSNNECFYTPEVMMIHSNQGLNDLSQKNHRVIREHIIRGRYKQIQRPILINNWEATYFDFDGNKIIDIARKASKLGVELMVLDDGWFGKRDSDTSGLGDWMVNESKLGMSLFDLVKHINALDMKFGLWFEPEMISEDSELYRTHPDWVFATHGQAPVLGRSQWVLDFSRAEVVDYITESICKVIDSANIEYLKLDMNRNITNVYSATAKHQNQGYILYHYTLGVYRFLETLITRYPHILIEGCSGGGGRFDAGMLYYTPQIWTSDNTDAIDRLKIQHGTSYAYPVSSMGAHISAVPNHQTERITSMKTRSVVAMSGSFGYELDLNTITDEDAEQVKQFNQDFKDLWNVIHRGDYFRLTDASYDQHYTAWMFVSVDQSEALVNVVRLQVQGNAPFYYLKLKGLHPKKQYELKFDEYEYSKNMSSDRMDSIVLSGDTLMNVGIVIPRRLTEYEAWQVRLKAV